MNGGQAIAQILKSEGVEHVFCFPFTPILDSLAEVGIRPIVARQERVAENMADGFSRIHNGKKIGVVTVQQSAGAENAFAGIAQANTDSSPILFLPGHPGRDAVGVSPTFDSVKNYSATTKWADMIPSANAVAQRMRRAFTLLRSGRPGPVMLEVPMDVAAEELTDALDYSPVQFTRFGADPDTIRDAAKLLLAAERPMIWAGQGVLYAEATAELTELAELIPAPVMSTLLGKSAFNERHPLSLGTGSYAATQMVRDYLTQSDALFAIGASLTRTLFAPPIPPGTRIVHATVDATDLNKDYVADVPLLGDAQLILRQLIEEIKSQRNGQVDERRRALIEEINSIREPWQQRWKTKRASAAAPINPYRLINDLMKTVDPANTIITHDSGNPRDQLLPQYEAINPRGYLGWGHSTQLGFSLGAIMGAKLAAPEKLAINFLGDAAFGMVGMDVETAVREQIPILTVLMNNSGMGNYEKNIPISSERYGTKFLTGNYSEVARGLGAFSERIEQPQEIIPALERAIAATQDGQPALLEFITCEEADMPIV
ncbi:MAG: thiamine pyrophosphate-requiring protein [Pirellulaceae bacterium]|nr:thiamine pyrophosphate-requiring protein [Pirellulaceae bacterium]